MHTNTVAPVPRWTFAMRVAQLILAILVLICVIVPLAIFVGYYGYGFGIFVSLSTIIITSYWIVASTRKPALYNMWAVLGLDIFMIIFWLSSWSILAELAAALAVVDGVYNAYGDSALDTNANWNAARALTGLGAFFGAVEFVTFIITLVFHSIGIHRTRRGQMQGNVQAYPRNQETMAQDKDFPNATATELPNRRSEQV